MHIKTKVRDLSLRQWDYLQENVEHEHQFRDGEVRVCVEFELTPDLHAIHVELPITDLAGMLVVLQAIERAAQAEAILTDTEQIVGRVTGPPLAEKFDPATGRYTVVEENQPIGGRMAELDLLDEISERSGLERPDGC